MTEIKCVIERLPILLSRRPLKTAEPILVQRTVEPVIRQFHQEMSGSGEGQQNEGEVAADVVDDEPVDTGDAPADAPAEDAPADAAPAQPTPAAEKKDEAKKSASCSRPDY
jgi:hypothetical protein